jgi:hypothetical protein
LVHDRTHHVQAIRPARPIGRLCMVGACVMVMLYDPP